MGNKSAVVARHDALEQYAYAAVVGDRDGMRDAVSRFDAAAEVGDGKPSDDVKLALVAADPVSAAASGWLTFTDLHEAVRQDPDAYLDPEEAQAFNEQGAPVLRRIVACRKEGIAFTAAVATRDDFVLAARGRVTNPNALARLLAEHGLETDEEDSNE